MRLDELYGFISFVKSKWPFQIAAAINHPLSIIMSAHQQQAKLVFVVICLWLLAACSKNDTLPIPTEEQVSRHFYFNIQTGENYSDEALKNTRIKIRLSLSAINVTSQQRTMIWDTLISRSSVHDLFSKERSWRLGVALTAPQEAFRHVVASYNVILEHKGIVTNRSGAASRQDTQKDIPIVI